MCSINPESISALQKKFAAETKENDTKCLEDCLFSFSEYAAAIYELEVYLLMKGSEADPDDRERLEKKRTNAHESVIGSLEMLNGYCGHYDISPVYPGTLSRKYPFRVEIADAALAYYYDILKNRFR